jgi:hypothetical protein
MRWTPLGGTADDLRAGTRADLVVAVGGGDGRHQGAVSRMAHLVLPPGRLDLVSELIALSRRMAVIRRANERLASLVCTAGATAAFAGWLPFATADDLNHYLVLLLANARRLTAMHLNGAAPAPQETAALWHALPAPDVARTFGSDLADGLAPDGVGDHARPRPCDRRGDRRGDGHRPRAGTQTAVPKSRARSNSGCRASPGGWRIRWSGPRSGGSSTRCSRASAGRPAGAATALRLASHRAVGRHGSAPRPEREEGDADDAPRGRAAGQRPSAGHRPSLHHRPEDRCRGANASSRPRATRPETPAPPPARPQGGRRPRPPRRASGRCPVEDTAA